MPEEGEYQPPEEQPEQTPDIEIAPQNPTDSEIRPGVAERLASRKAHRPDTFTEADLNQLRRDMHELAPTIEEKGERPAYYYLRARELIMEEAMAYGRVTPELIARQLVTTMYHADVFDHHEAYRAVDTLRWGFLAYAAQREPAVFQSEGTLYRTGTDYNKMQREAMEQHGHRVEGVTLDPEQTQALTWLLDQLAIPHDLRKTETHISFASMEEQLRIAAAEHAAANPSDPRWKAWDEHLDHEFDVDTSNLMEQWKEQDNPES